MNTPDRVSHRIAEALLNTCVLSFRLLEGNEGTTLLNCLSVEGFREFARRNLANDEFDTTDPKIEQVRYQLLEAL